MLVTDCMNASLHYNSVLIRKTPKFNHSALMWLKHDVFLFKHARQKNMTKPAVSLSILLKQSSTLGLFWHSCLLEMVKIHCHMQLHLGPQQ